MTAILPADDDPGMLASMNRVAVVQARMGSTRLPGKVLRHVAGRTVLGHVLKRLAASSSLDGVVVATSTSETDDPVADFAAAEGVGVYRGSEGDVLERYVGAARAAGADVVVRVTGDCPLIDPWVTARVVHELTGSAGRVDYASNVLRRTFPRGLDVEAMNMDTLLRLDRVSRTPAEREHVTIAVRSTQSRLFSTRSVEAETDDSDLRWTVDEPADLELVGKLLDAFDGEGIAPYASVVDFVRQHPELASINEGIDTWSP